MEYTKTQKESQKKKSVSDLDKFLNVYNKKDLNKNQKNSFDDLFGEVAETLHKLREMMDQKKSDLKLPNSKNSWKTSKQILKSSSGSTIDTQNNNSNSNPVRVSKMSTAYTKNSNKRDRKKN